MCQGDGGQGEEGFGDAVGEVMETESATLIHTDHETQAHITQEQGDWFGMHRNASTTDKHLKPQTFTTAGGAWQ